MIIVSVALGYAAAQYAAHREERQLSSQALKAIIEELKYNKSILEPLVPLHTQWLSRLADPDVAAGGKPGVDILFGTRPPLPAGAPSPFPFLRHSAWDAAVAGGVLPLLDFELVSTLSNIYSVQQVVTENIARLAHGPLAQIDIYERDKGAASARLLWLTIGDIESAEALLLELYKKNLAELEGEVAK